MKKYISIVIKLCVVVVLCFAYNLYLQAYEPIFTTDLALQQMQNYDTSTSGISAYSYIRNYGWVFIFFITVLLFCGNALDLLKKITNKGEHENEKTDSE